MANVEMVLGEIDKAVLSIFYDDKNMKVNAVKMNNGGQSTVKLTILDEVTEQPVGQPFVFGPGTQITVNIPSNQQKNFALEQKQRPDGTTVTVMTLPKYIYEKV